MPSLPIARDFGNAYFAIRLLLDILAVKPETHAPRPPVKLVGAPPLAGVACGQTPHGLYLQPLVELSGHLALQIKLTEM
jgi:hypothetical protein